VNTDPSSSPLAFMAAELKRLRSLAGMTQEQLAEATMYSPATVAAIETCRLIASKEFAEHADKAFSSSGFRDLARLEQKAAEIREYDSYVIAGLLQTERYAEQCVNPTRPELTPDEIGRAVALRMTRQKILDADEPPRLWVVMDESALYRVNGDAEIMREQLEHLIVMSERPGVVITIIPSGEGSTAAGGRSFTILTFKAETPVVYLEDIKSARYVRKTDEVAIYNLTFEHLRSSALTDVKSRALIREAIKRYAK